MIINKINRKNKIIKECYHYDYYNNFDEIFILILIYLKIIKLILSIRDLTYKNIFVPSLSSIIIYTEL